MPRKIAVLGNMNNNGVSILRYLRENGHNAFLFLFFNDGRGSLAHFIPGNALEEHDYLHSYIKTTSICNWPHQLLPSAAGKCYLQFYNLIQKLRRRPTVLSYASRATTADLLNGFDYIVTSGYGPAILRNAGLRNFVFFPYCIGIEGIERAFFPRWSRFIARLSFELARKSQISALKRSKMTFVIDTLAMQNARSYSIPCKFMLTPIVNVTKSPTVVCSQTAMRVAKITRGCSIKIFSFPRIIYTDETLKKNGEMSKNNDWVVRALKSAIFNLGVKPSLKVVMVEYGPDVERLKDEILKSGLTEYFEWISVVPKRDLLALIPYFDACLGEFVIDAKTAFGSGGWEVMACGKLLVNGFSFEPGEFEDLFKIPEMPFFKVKAEQDLVRFFMGVIGGEIDFQSTGEEAKKWFYSYYAKTLVSDWIKEIEMAVCDDS